MEYCSRCGGMMLGDGDRVVLHCEFAEWEDYDYLAPDDNPVECRCRYEEDENE